MNHPAEKAKITSNPLDPDKFYGYLMFHTWFFEWDSIEQAFEEICEMYRTQKWWDYDGFAIYSGVPDWMGGVANALDWKAILTQDQRDLLVKLKHANFKMPEPDQS